MTNHLDDHSHQMEKETMNSLAFREMDQTSIMEQNDGRTEGLMKQMPHTSGYAYVMQRHNKTKTIWTAELVNIMI